jgi:hypothetical protein
MVQGKHSSAEKEPTPLLGFNNNVRYKGRLFHIQTEDSGVRHARITTHLFADGGRIVQSLRAEYSEHLGLPTCAQTVRLRMKEQHKAMFLALRAGRFDDLVVGIFGPFPEPEEEAGPASRPPTLAVAATATVDGENAVNLSLPPVARPEARAKIPSAWPGPKAQAARTQGGRPRPSAPRPARKSAPPQGPALPAKAHGIFGGSELPHEKSLDEVILSYLAEDLADEA